MSNIFNMFFGVSFYEAYFFENNYSHSVWYSYASCRRTSVDCLGNTSTVVFCFYIKFPKDGECLTGEIFLSLYSFCI